MAAQFLSEDAGYEALSPVLAAAGSPSMEGCRFLPTIIGVAEIYITVVKHVLQRGQSQRIDFAML